eukprot:6184839-Pleurochrysis_carterae.AAC.3
MAGKASVASPAPDSTDRSGYTPAEESNAVAVTAADDTLETSRTFPYSSSATRYENGASMGHLIFQGASVTISISGRSIRETTPGVEKVTFTIVAHWCDSGDTSVPLKCIKAEHGPYAATVQRVSMKKRLHSRVDPYTTACAQLAWMYCPAVHELSPTIDGQPGPQVPAEPRVFEREGQSMGTCCTPEEPGPAGSHDEASDSSGGGHAGGIVRTAEETGWEGLSEAILAFFCWYQAFATFHKL